MTAVYDHEPIKGLPIELPPDERILWQGSPSGRGLARHLCHVLSITLYFAAIMAWRAVISFEDGRAIAEISQIVAWLSALLGVVVGFLGLFAFFVSRTTIYTITTRRVVLRYGIAFTKSVNVPLRLVEQAGLRLHAGGKGDITLKLKGPDKIAYLILWPHVRPWRLASPQPMLRCVPNAQAAARILSEALKNPSSQSTGEEAVVNEPLAQPTSLRPPQAVLAS